MLYILSADRRSGNKEAREFYDSLELEQEDKSATTPPAWLLRGRCCNL